MAAADPVEALVAFLAADVAVAARVGTRVFGGELPTSENASMPRAAIVVSPAGGLGAFGGGYQQYSDGRFDVDCYGATERSSWELYLDVKQALKQLDRQTVADVLLHWARTSAEGNTGRDPQTDWPVTLSSWQVLAAELSTA